MRNIVLIFATVALGLPAAGAAQDKYAKDFVQDINRTAGKVLGFYDNMRQSIARENFLDVTKRKAGVRGDVMEWDQEKLKENADNQTFRRQLALFDVSLDRFGAELEYLIRLLRFYKSAGGWLPGHVNADLLETAWGELGRNRARLGIDRALTDSSRNVEALVILTLGRKLHAASDREGPSITHDILWGVPMNRIKPVVDFLAATNLSAKIGPKGKRDYEDGIKMKDDLNRLRGMKK
ncbi:MAG: hypothetical protein HY401_02465 [Elusimicrobia bacterium]|nr:hypothetical protein [Elusimicrobiota bacterium]